MRTMLLEAKNNFLFPKAQSKELKTCQSHFETSKNIFI